MANECSTVINITGHKEGIEELAKILKDFEAAPKDNGYNAALGLPDCAKYEAEGASYEIDVTDISETEINIYQNDKWSENVWRWYALAGELGLKVYWQAFEPGCEYYATNDKDRSVFKANYVFNCYSEEFDEKLWGDLHSLVHDNETDAEYTANSEDEVIQQWSGCRFKTLKEAEEAIHAIDPDASISVNEISYISDYEGLKVKWDKRGAVIRQCKPFAKDKDAIYKLRELVHSMSADDFVGFKNLIESQGVDKALKAYSIALQI